MQTTAHYTAGPKVNILTIVRDEPRRIIASLVVNDEEEAREIAAEVGSKFSTDPRATGPSPEAIAAWRQLRSTTRRRSYPTRITDNRAAYRRKQLGLPPLQQTH
jgi:hypothetical protein